jgi:hypothetical protein
LVCVETALAIVPPAPRFSESEVVTVSGLDSCITSTNEADELSVLSSVSVPSPALSVESSVWSSPVWSRTVSVSLTEPTSVMY